MELRRQCTDNAGGTSVLRLLVTVLCPYNWHVILSIPPGWPTFHGDDPPTSRDGQGYYLQYASALFLKGLAARTCLEVLARARHGERRGLTKGTK